ncbi:MAG TPA: PKD domain-containing protein, partial [Bacteroidales bacterium]|nr:PKD domain-containing protein [Bacteroidales bacterium]
CIASDDVIITYYVLPQVDFAPDPQSGCPPLTVDFINGSIGGNPFRWDFGDGSVSEETNPMHTYTVPGEYNVTLTGAGPDGIMITKDTVVIVREQPDAEMEVTPNLVYISNPPEDLDNPVHFFTLTENVDSVVWDFGDGTFSNEMNPLHRYGQTGVYDINLQVFTGYQCFDNEAFPDAVTAVQKGSINCPNAFTPNVNGPAGGVINPNDYSNDVFHCYAQGILEYHLAIYNRLGILLFESDDVNVGWDGYFKGKLAEEGVYVYHVSGKYNSGEEFSKIGSVVLLNE